MSLSPGARLGVYEITGLIGAGGMGEVYRASDTVLKRQVALKLLPPDVAADPERIARFQREAETLAALNHPHIAQIYGLEKSGHVTALVLELVDGPTLADRIAKGPIPLDEALPIARQTAEALEAAHEQRIIHRDLKPANIKVRLDGTVKVLDFGLAKATAGARAAGELGRTATLAGELTQAPTITSPAMTRLGVILGTAAYMSPEQAKGRPADKRSDLWSFGCVLYEMLTGKRPFDGDDVSDTLAAVLRGDPDWTALPVDTPASIRRLLYRCLEKDRTRRLADASDARLEIDDIAREPSAPPPAGPQLSRRREYIWAAAASIFFVATAVMVARNIFARTPRSESRVTQFEVPAPEGVAIAGIAPALSPDGRALVFAGTSGDVTRLWIRRFDAAAAQPLSGTEDASRPFWSTDSRFIGFFAQGQLKKVATAGGVPENVCDLPPDSSSFNGTWNAAGIILFATNGNAGRLFQVSAAGGQPKPAMPLDESIGERRQSYPSFLPDGRHFLFLSYATGRPATDRIATSDDTTPIKPPTVTVGSLDSADRRELPITNSEVRYSSTGHLLFLRDGALMAQGFESERLEVSGQPFRVADDVGEGPAGSFSASLTGDIAFRPTGSSGSSQLVWYDRSGTRGSPLASVGDYRNPELSPDGKLVAFERGAQGRTDIWIMDGNTGRASRLTTDPGPNVFPLWSSDGSSIVFFSTRDPATRLYRRAVGAVGRDEALPIDSRDPPTDWSRDGRYLVFGSRGDLWAYTMTEHTPPVRLTETSAREREARVSPDGRWIAYSSNESGGRYDVYLQSFPQPGLKQIVSTAGGMYPRWSRDGKELLYIAPNAALMSASVRASETTAVVGTPVQLFLASGLPFGGDAGPIAFRANYDVAADGRFLINDAGGSYQRPITVILNWHEELKQRMPTR